ncbi:four helix bundle protein [Sulfurovum sp. CS9]|uniref:four helix bundle protein n=1 Tax=Sulfurovum sp. CS9 TaxID=3391146 RepID=UPI0039ECDD18
MVKTHKDLDVWKQSIQLVKQIYKITQIFPKHEIYGLTNQIRRAAVSVPSNIAEGAGRNSDKEFIQFLHISLGSLAEVETQLIISMEIGYVNNINTPVNEINNIQKMLNGLIKHIKNRQKNQYAK